MSMLSESQTEKGIKCISLDPDTWHSECPWDVLSEKRAWTEYHWLGVMCALIHVLGLFPGMWVIDSCSRSLL